jgi:hypothetical protein
MFLPFRTVGRNSFSMFQENFKMGYFVNKGYDEGLRIKMVVYRNTMGLARSRGAVIAQFGLPIPCYPQMNAMLFHFGQCPRNSRLRQIFLQGSQQFQLPLFHSLQNYIS